MDYPEGFVGPLRPEDRRAETYYFAVRIEPGKRPGTEKRSKTRWRMAAYEWAERLAGERYELVNPEQRWSHGLIPNPPISGSCASTWDADR